MENLIEIKNLSIKYDDFFALENVSLNIKQNKFITIIGPNGGGKTTLIKSILGFINPTKGSIKLKKNLVIGYVPQKDDFEKAFPIKVKDVILSGLLDKKIHLFHKYSNDNKLSLKKVLNSLKIAKLQNKHINELSGGELQKVFLARALISNPSLIILDEPFANIDTHSTKDYYEILKKLSNKMTILLISHDIGVISTYTDDIICVNKKTHYHDSNKLDNDTLQSTYGCPVEVIGHGIPHRVFPSHTNNSKVGDSND